MIAARWRFWAWYQISSALLAVLGWVVLIPPAAFHLWVERPGTDPMFPDRTVWAWRGRWLTVYCNEEDGIAGGAKPTALSAYLWSAWRNCVNGKRREPGVEYLTTSTVRFRDTKHGYVATDGDGHQYVAWRGLHAGWLMRKGCEVGGWRAWPVIGRA